MLSMNPVPRSAIVATQILSESRIMEATSDVDVGHNARASVTTYQL